jgi:hypothetical protein
VSSLFPPFRCALCVRCGFNILLKEIPASVKIRLIRVIRVPHSPSNSKPKTQDSRLLSGQQPEPYKAFKTYKKANKEDYHRSERNGRRGQIQFPFSPLKSLSCMLSCMPSMPCMVQCYARPSSKSSPPFRSTPRPLRSPRFQHSSLLCKNTSIKTLDPPCQKIYCINCF